MSYTLEVDIVIIGGGIAGLWLLSRLRSRGYDVLLVEGDHLGAGQTISSQGIIYGSSKYTLKEDVSGTPQAISAMPAVWRQCLAGEGQVDLSGTGVLAGHHYAWSLESNSVSLVSRLRKFFAGKAMRSAEETAETVLSEDIPPALRHERFRGRIYRLDEPVVDTASLLKVLAAPHRDALVLNQGPAVLAPDGAITLRSSGREPVVVRARRRTVFTAGVGNAFLGGAPMQTRPLHMVMVRGDNLPDGLYVHCLENGAIPRLIITSHRDAAGKTVWYLGGLLAEVGVEHDGTQQIGAARRELADVLPWVDLSGAQFAALRVNLAEARQRGGRRPDLPGVFQSGRIITAWPTRLAMVPMLADEVLTLLERDHIQPRPSDLSLVVDWPRPEVATYPWDEEREWYGS